MVTSPVRPTEPSPEWQWMWPLMNQDGHFTSQTDRAKSRMAVNVTLDESRWSGFLGHWGLYSNKCKNQSKRQINSIIYTSYMQGVETYLSNWTVTWNQKLRSTLPESWIKWKFMYRYARGRVDRASTTAFNTATQHNYMLGFQQAWQPTRARQTLQRPQLAQPTTSSTNTKLLSSNARTQHGDIEVPPKLSKNCSKTSGLQPPRSFLIPTILPSTHANR
jgi:hypothetical protein